MVNYVETGCKIAVTIKSVKGECGRGHKAGDKFVISTRDAAGLCGRLYHDIFPTIQMLQYGGLVAEAQHKGFILIDCPDRDKDVLLELRPMGPFVSPTPESVESMRKFEG